MGLLFRDKKNADRTEAGGLQIAWMWNPFALRFTVAAYNLRQLKYFITTVEWDPVNDKYGALIAIVIASFHRLRRQLERVSAEKQQQENERRKSP